MTRTNQRGFTLTEMIVVVGIIAILASLVFSVNSRTYGANAQNTAEQFVSTFNFCKMRAVATRRWHRCEVTGSAASTNPKSITVYQWSATGMATPAGSCSPPSTNCWQQVQRDGIQSGAAVWDGSTTVYAAAGATVTAENTSLAFDIDFKPDGTSTGGSVFVTDAQAAHKWRVLVYKATGSSYAREFW